MGSTTVLVADGQPVFLDGLRAYLDRAGDTSVVSVVRSGADAIAEAVELRPDVAVLDAELPCTDGMTAARRIGEHVPDAVVLMLVRSREQVVTAVAAGAVGCVGRNTDPEDILTAIRVVARGGFIVNGVGVAEVRERLGTHAPRRFPRLTSREQEVLLLLARDTDTRGIARQLGITMKTVRNHVSNILVKLPAATRGEARRIARDAGL